MSKEQALNPDASTFHQLFEEDYIGLFGRAVEGMDIEITVWSVNTSTIPVAVTAIDLSVQFVQASSSGERRLFDPALGENVQADIILRNSLEADSFILGPAVITEDETTIILPSSRQAICQTDGCIDIQRIDTTQH